jgi:L-malate glycosyltransferase
MFLEDIGHLTDPMSESEPSQAMTMPGPGQSGTEVAEPPSGAVTHVLFVHFGDDWIAGSEIALLELIEALAGKNVRPFLWCNSEAMRREASARGVPVRRDDLTHYLDYGSPGFSAVGFQRQLRGGLGLLGEAAADLVHCNGAAPAQWMRWPAWRRRTPMLVNLHSPYLKRSRYALGVHLADQVVAVTHAVAAPLLADGMPPGRVGVVYNGFDEATLLRGEARGLRHELGIPDDAVVAAIAGSLIVRKGHDVLFAAMRQLGELPLPFRLLVLGDGPERGALEAAAQDLPVSFLGRRNDIGPILRDSVDLLVAPSRQEAFGRVILEAAFAGKPAIGTRVDGIPEAIDDGQTGVLVPSESPLELARAIAAMARDVGGRRTMGLAARARARERFTLEASSDAMLAQYRVALGRSDRSLGAALRGDRMLPYWNAICR